MDEIWRTITEAPNYEISSEGRVRNKKTGRVLKLHSIGKVPIVTLMDGGFRLTRSVPKLVEQTFVF